MRPREFFTSDSQYKRYLLAVEYAEKIIYLQQKGYLILEPDGTVLQGTMVITKDDDWAAIKTVENDCSMGLICFSYGDDGVPWIEDTLNEIHEFFRSYKCINPKYMYSIHIKNPNYKKLDL